MDGNDSWATLPEAYATALRLQGAGANIAEIARSLSIDEDAVPALLRLADAKLTESGVLAAAIDAETDAAESTPRPRRSS